MTRQTTQHLEFEPEWEGAFNLQLKLEDSIVLFTEWCAADVSLVAMPHEFLALLNIVYKRVFLVELL